MWYLCKYYHIANSQPFCSVYLISSLLLSDIILFYKITNISCTIYIQASSCSPLYRTKLHSYYLATYFYLQTNIRRAFTSVRIQRSTIHVDAVRMNAYGMSVSVCEQSCLPPHTRGLWFLVACTWRRKCHRDCRKLTSK